MWELCYWFNFQLVTQWSRPSWMLPEAPPRGCFASDAAAVAPFLPRLNPWSSRVVSSFILAAPQWLRIILWLCRRRPNWIVMLVPEDIIDTNIFGQVPARPSTPLALLLFRNLLTWPRHFELVSQEVFPATVFRGWAHLPSQLINNYPKVTNNGDHRVGYESISKRIED